MGEGEFKDLKKSGWPRKTNACDDHVIRRMVMRSPAVSCKKTNHYLAAKDTDVNLSTISKKLTKNSNFLSYKPATKLRLTRNIKKKTDIRWKNIKSGQYNCIERYYFPMSQVFSHFLLVLEIFTAPWE